MRIVPDGHRFAPPSAHVEDVATPGAVELGGRGARLGAVLLDGVAIAIVFGILSSVFMSGQFELVRTGAMSVARWTLYQGVAGFAVFLVLNGYTLATRGQTLGKILLGLRIVRSNGSRASFARIVGLRYVLNNVLIMVPLVGGLYALADCLLIFRASHKCLHDNIADTIVVKA
jgi:uncharacterized RDD family membrane protein YckC